MAKRDEAVSTFAAGCIELELHTPPPRQTAELAQQFVAGHKTWMAIDIAAVKARAGLER
jgi:hypothetical protein